MKNISLKNVPLSFEPSKNELDLRIPEIPEKEIESEIDLTKADTGLVLKPQDERPIEEKPQPPIIQPAASRQQVIIARLSTAENLSLRLHFRDNVRKFEK